MTEFEYTGVWRKVPEFDENFVKLLGTYDFYPFGTFELFVFHKDPYMFFFTKIKKVKEEDCAPVFPAYWPDDIIVRHRERLDEMSQKMMSYLQEEMQKTHQAYIVRK